MSENRMYSLHVCFTEIKCECCDGSLEGKKYPNKMHIFCPNSCDDNCDIPILGPDAMDDIMPRLAMGTIETKILWQSNSQWARTFISNYALAASIIAAILLVFVAYYIGAPE